MNQPICLSIKLLVLALHRTSNIIPVLHPVSDSRWRCLCVVISVIAQNSPNHPSVHRFIQTQAYSQSFEQCSFVLLANPVFITFNVINMIKHDIWYWSHLNSKFLCFINVIVLSALTLLSYSPLRHQFHSLILTKQPATIKTRKMSVQPVWIN